jgi:hypothetical protein
MHFDQSNPLCDSLDGIIYAKNHGAATVELNSSAGKTKVWDLHWPEGPSANHYNFIFVRRTIRGKEKRREMTHAEKTRNVMDWDENAIPKWRKTLVADHRMISRQKPATITRRSYQCRVRGLVPVVEAKSGVYRFASYATRLVNSMKAAGVNHPRIQVLATIPYWRGKVVAFHGAAAHVILLPHRAKKPSDLAEYRPYIDTISGRWA